MDEGYDGGDLRSFEERIEEYDKDIAEAERKGEYHRATDLRRARQTLKNIFNWDPTG